MSSRFSKSQLSQKLNWGSLDTNYLEHIITLSKKEDLGGLGLLRFRESNTLQDLSSDLISSLKHGSALIVARTPCIACGVKLIPMILKTYDPNLIFESFISDGDYVSDSSEFGVIKGPASSLLSAERIILNFLQYLSGIASNTKRFTDCLKGSSTRLLDTRKTTPLFRMLEKYAFTCGGGFNHRYGLFDRIMIKDNHLASLKSDTKEIDDLQKKFPNTPIHIEVDNLEQIDLALSAGADCVLLDNFSIEQLKAAISLIKNQAYVEASGGVTLDILPRIKNLGLDFISTGAPIHQSQWVDIGLDWE